MKLSSASRHAVCALAYLAGRPAGACERRRDIARASGMPDAYLMKILSHLARAGLLYAARGPGGGYGLARPAREITLLAIIEAAEGPIGGAAMAGGGATALDRRLQAVCDGAAELLRERLAEVTLAKLAGKK